jgi:hypothetical protein
VDFGNLGWCAGSLVGALVVFKFLRFLRFFSKSFLLLLFSDDKVTFFPSMK